MELAAGWHKWALGAAVALCFLVPAMVQVAVSGGSTAAIVAFEALTIAFAAAYLLVPPWASSTLFRPPTDRAERLRAWSGLSAMLALTVPMIAIGGAGVAAVWIYIAVCGAALLPARPALVVAAALAGGMLTVSALATDRPHWSGLPWELALTLLALTGWMIGFAGNIRTTQQLRTAQRELADAAVTAERERIGRDLHDILGHSLTAITVKTALARRLLPRDRTAAAAEMDDVERLARDALTDVRATAAGYRDASLAGELAVARSVLQAADIQAELPTAVDDVTPAGREVFGYVVREAVTNVLRHSRARHCAIELGSDRICITDDGACDRSPDDRPGDRPAGPGPADDGARDRPADDRPAGAGTGLSGLAERVRSVGGTLQAGPLPTGGFRVLATVGPARPRTASS